MLLLLLLHHDWKLLVHCHSVAFYMSSALGARQIEIYFCLNSTFLFHMFRFRSRTCLLANLFMRHKLFMFWRRRYIYSTYFICDRSAQFSMCRNVYTQCNLFAFCVEHAPEHVRRGNAKKVLSATSKSKNCVRHQHIKNGRQAFVICLLDIEWMHCHLIKIGHRPIAEYALKCTQPFILLFIFFCALFI